MQPASFYTAAREFLARARPTPDPTTYKRRVQGMGQLLPAGLPSPGTRLRPSPISFEIGLGSGLGVLGAGEGDEIDDSSQHVRDCLSWSFDSATDAGYCGKMTPILAAPTDPNPWTCGPTPGTITPLAIGEWGAWVDPVFGLGGGFAMQYFNAHTYKHANYITKIRNPLSAMIYAGLWVEGDDPSQGFAVVIDPGGNVTVFDQGGAIDGATTVFVEAAPLEIRTPGLDASDTSIWYNGSQLLAESLSIPRFGRCGIYGFGKGWVQTLSITDLRCSVAGA